MISVMGAQTLLTVEQFSQLPEEEVCRYELIEGELVEVSSGTLRHNKVRDRIFSHLNEHLKSVGIGLAVIEVDLSLDAVSVRRPDLAFFSNAKLQGVDEDKIPVQVAPELAVEVISPSDTMLRMNQKIRWCLANGVQEVWVVFLEDREVHVHGAPKSVRKLTAEDVLETKLLPGFSVRVAEIFEP
ncbi:MAG: Uma2 family endonuclease [Bryobacteraceae bacterium]